MRCNRANAFRKSLFLLGYTTLTPPHLSPTDYWALSSQFSSVLYKLTVLLCTLSPAIILADFHIQTDDQSKQQFGLIIL